MRDEGLARTVREAVEISGDRKFGGVHLALFAELSTATDRKADASWLGRKL
jgi:hypothetical protein